MKKDLGEIVIRISPFVSDEERVDGILEGLEAIKASLAEMSIGYEKKGKESMVDCLTDALESIDNSIDALNDLFDDREA